MILGSFGKGLNGEHRSDGFMEIPDIIVIYDNFFFETILIVASLPGAGVSNSSLMKQTWCKTGPVTKQWSNLTDGIR